MVTYLVKYKEQGGQVMTKEIDKCKEITIDGLKNFTIYNIYVGVSESTNGASTFSSKFLVRTSNGKSLERILFLMLTPYSERKHKCRNNYRSKSIEGRVK